MLWFGGGRRVAGFGAVGERTGCTRVGSGWVHAEGTVPYCNANRWGVGLGGSAGNADGEGVVCASGVAGIPASEFSLDSRVDCICDVARNVCASKPNFVINNL